MPAPGTFDPPGFKLGDCTTQRNLSETGREEARRRRTNRELSLTRSVPDVDEMAMALVNAERVRAAVETLVADVRIDVVKVGMLASRALVETVHELLSHGALGDVPVVLDPSKNPAFQAFREGFRAVLDLESAPLEMRLYVNN